MSPRKRNQANRKAGKTKAPNVPIRSFAQRAAWEAWLAKNQGTSGGLWLKLAKKGSPAASITYPEALEVALAWGWIDAQKRALDEAWWLQKFTPRAPRSPWSKVNRDKALTLIAAGKMKRPGLEEVERAQRDGRWQRAYDPPSRATVPKDLAVALAANPGAAAFFATLDAANRYAVLWRIQTANKEETRARRIKLFVEMLGRREKLH